MKQKSFTLIEVLVGVFLVLLVFLGIFGAYQLGIKVIGQSRNKIVATAIASGELEKIRNLDYGSVGVSGGFPDGVLEAVKTTTLNGVDYLVETRVDYAIDPTDGISLPEDECPNDYKKVKIKVSWSGALEGFVELSTDVSPKNLSQECSETGGILLVSVFDAFGQAVSGPLIEVRDPDTDQIVKSASPAEGSHFFSLEPGSYKVAVSKTNYSSARTYGIEEVAIPETPHPSVLEGLLTENSFSIDKLSSFSVRTYSLWGLDYFSDSFLDQSKISEISDLEAGEGEAVLTQTEGQYQDSGYLFSTEISPSDLLEWQELSWNDLEPVSTQILYQLFYLNGENWFLVPDYDLSGNPGGFGSSPIDLSGLDSETYPELKIKAIFSSSDPDFSPTLYDWQLSWKNSQAGLIAGAIFRLQGEKIIGLDVEENPVYKYSQEYNSGGSGQININNLEWDLYHFSIPPATGLDLAGIFPSPQPIALAPDTSLEVNLYLEAQNSLLLNVQDVDTGEPVFSATCRLQNSGLGYDKTQYTDQDGQTYFIPLEPADYSLEISAPGYSDYSRQVSVSGDVTKIINLKRIE